MFQCGLRDGPRDGRTNKRNEANIPFSQNANETNISSCAKMTVSFPLLSAAMKHFSWKLDGFCLAHLNWENVWRGNCLLCRVNMGSLNMGTLVATVSWTEGLWCCGLGEIVQPCFTTLRRYKQNVITLNIHCVENNTGVEQMSGQNWEQIANRVSKLCGKFVPTHAVKVYAYLHTYLLTPWSRFLLENLSGSQLVKKFPTFYGTQKFITTFTNP